MASVSELAVAATGNSPSNSWLGSTKFLDESRTRNGVSSERLANSTPDVVRQQIAEGTTDGRVKDPPRLSNDVDSCYAWLVLASCSLLQFVSFSPTIASGIFYAILTEEYQEQKTILTWAFGLQTSLIFLVAPLAAKLAEITSGRFMAMVGCIGTGFSLATLSFSTDLRVMNAAIITSGLSTCCTYLVACTHYIQYFNKYKIFGIALSTSVLPLGFLLAPTMVTYLLQLYGWREANLFISLLNLQAAGLAMFLREPKYRTAADTGMYFAPVESLHSTSSHKLHDEFFEKLHADSLSDSRHPADDGEDMHEWDLHLVSGATPSVTCTNSLLEQKGDTSTSSVTHSESLPRTTVLHWRVALSFGCCFFWGCSSAFYVLVPLYVQQNGLVLEQTANLFVIGGLASFATRILLAVTGHLLKYSKVLVSAGGMLLMGTALSGLTFTTTFAGYALMMSVYSSGLSVEACLVNAVTLELHGEYNIAVVFALQMSSYGLGAAIALPLTGLFNSLETGFHVLSIACVVGAVLYLPHLIIYYYRKKLHNISNTCSK